MSPKGQAGLSPILLRAQKLYQQLHALRGDPRGVPALAKELWRVCQEQDPEHAGQFFLEVFASSYGYKAANMLLWEQAFHKTGVSVPQVIPIRHAIMASFLDEAIPGWREDYKQALRSAPIDFPKLQQLQAKFRDAFTRNPDRTIEALGLKPFLTASYDATSCWMVRSTGREDTEETANAGGNESVSWVPPTAEAMAHAIAEVASSYMNDQSLQQQQVAGVPLDAEPFIPILIQRMIGAVPGEATHGRYASGVVFTREPQGPTPGVVVIDACFGHGSGVVDALAPADTYYCLDDGARYSVIRSKELQVGPLETGPGGIPNMGLQSNPAAIWDQPTLSARNLTLIDKVARQAAEFYGRPMDLEFVLDRQTQHLYVVQARPIVHPDSGPGAWIDRRRALALGLRAVQMKKCLVSGHQRPVLIRDPATELVVGKTLKEALDDAIDDKRGALPLAAIVDSDEAGRASAHAATTFRQAAIPVLVGPRPPLLNPSEGMVVDPQKRTCWVGPIDQLKQALATSHSGMVRHPVPSELTSSTLLKEEPKELIRHLLGSQFLEYASMSEADAAEKGQALETLLDELSDAQQPERVKGAYAFLSRKLESQYRKLLAQSPSQERLEEFGSLVAQIEKIGVRALRALERREGSRVALYASWIAALLFQQGGDTSGASLASFLRRPLPTAVIPQNRSQIEAIWGASATTLDKKEQALLLLGNLIVDERLGQQWSPVVEALLLMGPAQTDLLLKLVFDLQHFGLLEQWVEFELEPILRTNNPPKSTVDNLMATMERMKPEISEIAQKLDGWDNLLKSWNQRLYRWEHPSEWGSLWLVFQTDVLKRLHSELLPLIETADRPWLRAAVGHLLERIVDLFDQSVHAVKGIPGGGPEQFGQLARMISGLGTLARGTLSRMAHSGLLPADMENSIRQWAETETAICLDATSPSASRALLFPSAEFNVAQVMADVARPGPHELSPQPESLDDLLTLGHQILLWQARLLRPKAVPPSSSDTMAPSQGSELAQEAQRTRESLEVKNPALERLPLELRKLAAALTDPSRTSWPAQLKSTSATASAFCVDLHIPLACHSANVRLEKKRDTKVPTILVHIKFSGGAGFSRWLEIPNLFRREYGSHMTDATTSNSHCSFVLQLHPLSEGDANKLCEALEDSGMISFGMKPLSRRSEKQAPAKASAAVEPAIIKEFASQFVDWAQARPQTTRPNPDMELVHRLLGFFQRHPEANGALARSLEERFLPELTALEVQALLGVPDDEFPAKKDLLITRLGEDLIDLQNFVDFMVREEKDDRCLQRESALFSQGVRDGFTELFLSLAIEGKLNNLEGHPLRSLKSADVLVNALQSSYEANPERDLDLQLRYGEDAHSYSIEKVMKGLLNHLSKQGNSLTLHSHPELWDSCLQINPDLFLEQAQAVSDSQQTDRLGEFLLDRANVEGFIARLAKHGSKPRRIPWARAQFSIADLFESLVESAARTSPEEVVRRKQQITAFWKKLLIALPGDLANGYVLYKSIKLFELVGSAREFLQQWIPLWLDEIATGNKAALPPFKDIETIFPQDKAPLFWEIFGQELRVRAQSEQAPWMLEFLALIDKT
ncbi:MAG: PEP/pyruvate-binding domain-containing protein [Chlamydiia bacterium]